MQQLISTKVSCPALKVGRGVNGILSGPSRQVQEAPPPGLIADQDPMPALRLRIAGNRLCEHLRLRNALGGDGFARRNEGRNDANVALYFSLNQHGDEANSPQCQQTGKFPCNLHARSLQERAGTLRVSGQNVLKQREFKKGSRAYFQNGPRLSQTSKMGRLATSAGANSSSFGPASGTGSPRRCALL